MYHRTRWMPEKIKQRLELIAPLVYHKQKALPSFRYQELNRPLAARPVAMEVDDSHWQEALESAWKTNPLEENESELNVGNDSIQLNLRPYQIMTIRLREKI